MLNYRKIFFIAVCSVLSFLLKSAYADDIATTAAEELNRLYQRTTPCDNNEPAYYCSGIIIHGQLAPDKDNALPSWYLPGYRSIGSFSYLRADITSHVGEPIYINTGFILTPTDELEARNEFSYKLYCEYPGDGGSVGDVDSSCHFKSNNYLTICGDEIQTVNDFFKKYLNDSRNIIWEELDLDCSFSPEKDRFDLAMQLHQFIYKDNLDKTYCKDHTFCRVHNELMISAWDIKNVPDVKVPILAFYAIINDTSNPMFAASGRTSTSDAEMEQLFKDADAYSKATHYTRQIPIVTLDMSKLRSGAKDIFAPAVRPNNKLAGIN